VAVGAPGVTDIEAVVVYVPANTFNEKQEIKIIIIDGINIILRRFNHHTSYKYSRNCGMTLKVIPLSIVLI